MRSFLHVLLYRLSNYYYYDDYYYRLTGPFYTINYSYFEKYARRSKKNLNNISLSSNLRVIITCWIDLIETVVFLVKLVLYHCCAINMTVQKSTGLIFISVLLREYWCPFQWNQFTPSAKEECWPRRYKPLRFDLWHSLYHQAPLWRSCDLFYSHCLDP